MRLSEDNRQLWPSKATLEGATPMAIARRGTCPGGGAIISRISWPGEIRKERRAQLPEAATLRRNIKQREQSNDDLGTSGER